MKRSVKNNFFKKIFAVALLFAGKAAAQEQSTSTIQSFVKGKTDSAFAKSSLPGIFVAYSDGKGSYFYTTGYADPDAKKAFDESTLFEIGSITKTFTAYVLMCVLRDQQISDTSSIISFLPKAVQANKELQNIRFLSLMNHSSGLPRLPENMELKEGDLQPYANYDSRMLFEYLQQATLHNPGKYQYSNLAAGLAGVLAERLSGKTYAALLDQYIFLPLKMVDEEHSLAKGSTKSQGFIADDSKSEYWNMNVLAPAGGLKCTGQEMMKYFAAMSRPVSEQSALVVDQLTAPTINLSPTVSVCRGWHSTTKANKPTVYWHNGGTYGFSTFGAFVKGTGQSVLVIINKFNSNAVSDNLGMQIINKMLE
ncbi:MAG: class A beta-lactamase-related serine hydrolase [Chitinophagaceae bacterium]|nr:MAG: class A beta-lactamase-related serine hydrolase [Chitinophagaceae bacterium]